MVSIGFLYQQFLWNSIYFFIQLVSPACIVHYTNSANTQNMKESMDAIKSPTIKAL